MKQLTVNAGLAVKTQSHANNNNKLTISLFLIINSLPMQRKIEKI